MAGIADSFRSFMDRGTKHIICLQCKMPFHYKHALMDDEDVSMTDICAHAAFNHPSHSTFVFQYQTTYSKKPDEFSSPVDTKITCDHLKDLLNQGYKIACSKKVGRLFIRKHGVFKAWLEPEQIPSTSTNVASSPASTSLEPKSKMVLHSSKSCE